MSMEKNGEGVDGVRNEGGIENCKEVKNCFRAFKRRKEIQQEKKKGKGDPTCD